MGFLSPGVASFIWRAAWQKACAVTRGRGDEMEGLVGGQERGEVWSVARFGVEKRRLRFLVAIWDEGPDLKTT